MTPRGTSAGNVSLGEGISEQNGQTGRKAFWRLGARPLGHIWDESCSLSRRFIFGIQFYFLIKSNQNHYAKGFLLFWNYF
jgi:hypothetical protein